MERIIRKLRAKILVLSWNKCKLLQVIDNSNDADVPQVQHYLKEHVVFKEAIPIKNPLALSKIHQTYRVGYLKVSQLPNKKETVYGALDKWVAWETEFPLIAAAKALQIFKKRSQWLRVIQVYSVYWYSYFVFSSF
ncbi:hypothetical protein GOBAR_DD29450 [Gossypium barbadense]|nr:hypothetical protein GOBAR_DD29450 [Gossypium barbadense]